MRSSSAKVDLPCLLLAFPAKCGVTFHLLVQGLLAVPGKRCHMWGIETDLNGCSKMEVCAVSHWLLFREQPNSGTSQAWVFVFLFSLLSRVRIKTFYMGQTLSTEQRQYIEVLKQLLKANGANINEEQSQHMLQVVLDINPWVPENGTLDVEVWERVCANLKQKHKLLLSALTTWGLVQTALAPLHMNVLLNASLPPPTPPTPGSGPCRGCLPLCPEKELKKTPQASHCVHPNGGDPSPAPMSPPEISVLHFI